MFCHRSVVCGAALIVAGQLLGCTTPRTSNTARTAVEQLLISNAVDQSLDKVDFRPFTRQKVYLSDTYIDSVDKPYVVGSVRHRLLTAGARLVDTPDEAQIIVEVRSGGVGTDTSNTFIGTPEFSLPGMLTVPEMKIAERSRQTGLAKIGLVAYDAKTREVLGSGGTALAQSTDSNWFVGGVGPYRRGTVKEEVTRGTSGGAAMKQTEVPNQVAFAPSRSAGKDEEPESEIQFASGSEPAKE
jgi:hypothetical protein